MDKAGGSGSEETRWSDFRLRKSYATQPWLLKLPLNLMRRMCELLDPSSVLAISATSKVLRACDGLPVNFCNASGFNTQFFMQPTQLLRFIRNNGSRYCITGATLRKCSDSDVVQILQATPRLQSLSVSSTYLTTLKYFKPSQGKGGRLPLRSLVLQNANSLLDANLCVECTSLQHLKITWSCSLNYLPDLRNCVDLREIDLYQCQEVLSIAPLAHCTKLRRVNISCLGRISDIRAVASLKHLEELDMSWCEALVDISPIASCLKICNLNLCHCAKLQEIQAIAQLTELLTLNLAQCRLLSNLLPLSECKLLQHLYLFACKSLSDIGPLACCTNLTTIDLSYCKLLHDVEPLVLLFELRKVNLTKTLGVRNAELLESMEYVEIIR